MGGTHSMKCNSTDKDIWQFCIEKEIWISAALIAGKSNTQVHRDSRDFINNDCSLQPILPYIAGAPDSISAKDTSTATDYDHAQNARERA